MRCFLFEFSVVVNGQRLLIFPTVNNLRLFKTGSTADFSNTFLQLFLLIHNEVDVF